MILVAAAACPAVVHAEEDHGENAKKHLEQAVESGSKGDVKLRREDAQ